MIYNSKIDLFKIKESGQCFRWNIIPTFPNNIGDIKEQYTAFNVPLDNTNVSFKQRNNELMIPEGDLYKTYLDLDYDYSLANEILKESTPNFADVYESLRGIYILNQPFFETCISFIISQNNNIPKIKTTINKICGGKYNPFPNALELLNSLETNDFSLGYRKDYIINFCVGYLNGEFNHFKCLSPYECVKQGREIEFAKSEEVIEELCSVKGIGPKVASCIALFTLNCKDVIPRDVWVKRIEEQFNIKWCKEYAGYQQQMLFYAIRNKLI